MLNGRRLFDLISCHEPCHDEDQDRVGEPVCTPTHLQQRANQGAADATQFGMYMARAGAAVPDRAAWHEWSAEPPSLVPVSASAASQFGRRGHRRRPIGDSGGGGRVPGPLSLFDARAPLRDLDNSGAAEVEVEAITCTRLFLERGKAPGEAEHQPGGPDSPR